MKYDLIVIGGGPAGYVGAIRATQLGKKVACVEADRAGGTCLNWGCIPTKSLLRNAELFQLLKHKGGEFGFSFDNLAYDWSKIIGRSRKVSDRLAGGIEFLFKKNKVDYIRGNGALLGGGKVEVTAKDGAKSVIEGEKILIATGCATREMPGLGFDGKVVIGSKDAMVLEQQPARARPRPQGSRGAWPRSAVSPPAPDRRGRPWAEWAARQAARAPRRASASHRSALLYEPGRGGLWPCSQRPNPEPRRPRPGP